MQNYIVFFSIIVVSFLFAKRYNFLQGIFTLYALVSLTCLIDDMTNKFDFLKSFGEAFKPMADICRNAILKPMLDFLELAISGGIKEMMFYIISIVAFIVWQFISSKIRASKYGKRPKRQFNGI